MLLHGYLAGHHCCSGVTGVRASSKSLGTAIVHWHPRHIGRLGHSHLHFYTALPGAPTPASASLQLVTMSGLTGAFLCLGNPLLDVSSTVDAAFLAKYDVSKLRIRFLRSHKDLDHAIFISNSRSLCRAVEARQPDPG